MTILVVGLGSIGSRHARLAVELGHEVIGVDCRPVEELNRIDHDRCRIVVYPTIEETIGLKIDAAIIATPPARHVYDARACMERGLPVLIEKPLSLSVAEAYSLKAAAVIHDVTVGVGMMERAHPTLRALKQRSVRPRMDVHFHCYWQATSRTYEWPGVLYETAHTLDLAYWFFGEVAEVKVHQLDDLRASLTLRHTSSVLSHLTLSANRPPHRWIAFHLRGDEWEEIYYGHEDWDECYQVQLEAFLAGRPLCTLKDGIEVMRLIAWIEATAQQRSGEILERSGSPWLT